MRMPTTHSAARRDRRLLRDWIWRAASIGFRLTVAVMLPVAGAAAQVLVNAPEGYSPQLPTARTGTVASARAARIGERQQVEDIAAQTGIQPLRRINNRLQSRVKTRIEARITPAESDRREREEARER